MTSLATINLPLRTLIQRVNYVVRVRIFHIKQQLLSHMQGNVAEQEPLAFTVTHFTSLFLPTK
jgi:hypothetical protein